MILLQLLHFFAEKEAQEISLIAVIHRINTDKRDDIKTTSRKSVSSS